VSKARTALTSAEKALGKANWTVGDLALSVQSRYGKSTVQKFAGDLGLPAGTVYDFRAVATAYPAEARGVATWTVHQILRKLDDRNDLVKSAMTAAEARAIVESRKPATPPVTPPAGDGEGEGDETPPAEPTTADLLAEAKAKVTRIRAELDQAEAEVTTLENRMNDEIKAAKAQRAPRTRKLAAA
jgi:hypothetical protein